MKWFGGHGYFNLFTIIENRGGHWRWNGYYEVEAEIENKNYIFIPESPVIKLNEKYINLPLSIKLYDDTLYFPEAFVDSVFGTQQLIIYKQTEENKNKASTIYDYHIKGNKKKVEINLLINGTFEYEDFWKDITVYEVKIKSVLKTEVKKKGLINNIRITKQKDYTIFDFSLLDRAYVYIKKTPKGLKITFEKKSKKVRKIVIDPGHGGYDSGAVGPGGTKEKDIVLKLAKLLENKLK